MAWNIVYRDSSYVTTFAATENPISEGGSWARNQSNAWTNVRTTGGNAVGTQIDNAYDDSYAILQGDWGADYKLTAIVYRSASISAANHETELLFRCADDADSARCYEVLLNKDGIVQVFRWNDTFGSFSAAMTVTGSDSVGSVPDGASFAAQIVGDTITTFYDSAGGTPIQIGTYDINEVSTPKWTTGNPGIGFFCRPSAEGSNPDHYGFKSVTVTRL